MQPFFVFVIWISGLCLVSSFSINSVTKPATSTRLATQTIWVDSLASRGRRHVHRTTRQDTSLRISPVEKIAKAYSCSAETHYFSTELLTYALFCAFGDLIAQTCELQSSKIKKNYDWNRFLQFFLKGIGCGLIWSSWYKVAEGWSAEMSTRAVSLLAPSSTNVARTLYKVIQTVSSILLEQFLACPIIYGLWDIPVLTLLKGKPFKSVPNEVKRKLGRLLVANAKMWTAANIIIYNVPLSWRVAVLSGADMIWQSIISANVARKTDQEFEIVHESLDIAKDAAQR